MKIIFLDFETYYDKDYTLRKMTPAEYILDPRYETICVATKVDDGPYRVIDAPDFPAWLAQFDPADTATVTFNALFDNCILAWHYGFVPARMIDALGMSRALLGHKLARLSLQKVAEHLEIGEKGNAINSVMGMHRTDIMSMPTLWDAFKQYARQDCALLFGIFQKLAPEFPPSEYRVMDLVLRATVQPRFMCDVPMLTAHLDEVRQEKNALLTGATLVGAGLGGVGAVTKADMMSSAKFQQMLEELGVEVEFKGTPAGNTVPCFAKTDEFMEQLQEHEDSRVQALAAARLGLKTTIEETRSERLLRVANLNWQTYMDGTPRLYSGGSMPIPLRYGGPHTHRLSGDWRMNMQNLPSGRGGSKSKLRKSLIVPAGHEVIVADLGQIEARLTAWLCRADVLFKAFAEGKDPYALLASNIFQMDVDPKVHKLERFIGKSGVLGLGFGAAAPKFYTMVVRMARGMNMDITPLNWSLKLAEKAVNTYRLVNAPIPAMWEILDHHLENAWAGRAGPVRVGPVEIGYRYGYGYVRGPNGLEMRYDKPDVSKRFNFTYEHGGRRHKIYGAKFLENIIQFLARIIVMDAAVRLSKRGLIFALQAHDELAFPVPSADVDRSKQIVHEEMTRRPSWALDLPLIADVNHGPSYGDAK